MAFWTAVWDMLWPGTDEDVFLTCFFEFNWVRGLAHGGMIMGRY